MSFMANRYANDGTEFIIFFDHGTHVLRRYDYPESAGVTVCRGNWEKCAAAMEREIVSINESCIG